MKVNSDAVVVSSINLEAISSLYVDGVRAAGLGDVDTIAFGQVDGAAASTPTPGDAAPLGAVVNEQSVVVFIQPEGSFDWVGRGVLLTFTPPTCCTLPAVSLIDRNAPAS